MHTETQELKDAGLKITAPRIKILQILESSSIRHMSAEDVYKQLISNEDEEDVMNVIRKLNGLKILTSSKYSGRSELSDKAIKTLKKEGFEELMIVKEGDEEIKFLIDEKDGKIREFVMVISGDEDGDFFLMSMTGNLDLKDISKLSETMDIDGFEHLDKVE